MAPIIPNAHAQDFIAGASQTIWEFDLNSDGSAKVRLTIFVQNVGNRSLFAANLTFAQGTFGLFVHDLLHGHDLDYTIGTIGMDSYTITVFFQPILEPNERTVIQITYNQSPIAFLSNAIFEAVQGIWVFALKFEADISNFRLIIRLPPSTEPWTLSVTPAIPQIYTEKYLDTDNRWVIVWLSALKPSLAHFEVKYRIATRLWVFAVAPAMTLACFVFILRIIRPRAAEHVKQLKDKVGAYTLWQMSLGIHLTILAVIVASWGLLLSQEVNPSLIDIWMLVQLAIVIAIFFADTSAHEKFIRSFSRDSVK